MKQYRLVQKPRSLSEEIEDALFDSGSRATIKRIVSKDRAVILEGDYADLILARKALERIKVSILVA